MRIKERLIVTCTEQKPLANGDTWHTDTDPHNTTGPGTGMDLWGYSFFIWWFYSAPADATCRNYTTYVV